jgi:hypothetical protein
MIYLFFDHESPRKDFKEYFYVKELNVKYNALTYTIKNVSKITVMNFGIKFI